MRVFHRLEEIAPSVQASAVAIGNFDGVHQGHAALLGHVLEYARRAGGAPTVLTFFPHPVEVLKPTIKLERISTTLEKLALFERMGVEQVLVEPFDTSLAALSPKEFFDRFFVHGLKAKSIHVGFDFHFGRGRAGTIETLREMSRAHGIHLQVQSPQSLGGDKISSSAIRELIREGNVKKAWDWLGRPYVLAGQVTRGDGRGAKIGFPTANVHYPAEKVLPKNGVYVTRVIWQKQSYRAVTNVGVRPTFHTAEKATVEAHLLDFEAKIYDEYVEVEFLERIRDERKFESVDALVKQIGVDAAKAREYTA